MKPRPPHQGALQVLRPDARSLMFVVYCIICLSYMNDFIVSCLLTYGTGIYYYNMVHGRFMK
jgi:hypothetical protein